MDPLLIRPVTAADDLAEITDMIHEAYAVHAARNLRYWATRQPVEDTERRFALGHGLLAVLEDKVVGTVTVAPGRADSSVPFFREKGAWLLSQFAVVPRLQRRGVGRRLHEAALAHARERGGRVMLLDTAQPASELIAMYQAWGYQIVGEADWRPKTNYLSVVMRLPLSPCS